MRGGHGQHGGGHGGRGGGHGGGGMMNVNLNNTKGLHGHIASYNLEKEYGFIKTKAPAAQGQDVMFHRQALPGQYFNAHGNDMSGKELLFDLVVNPSNGKLRADNLMATNVPSYRSRVKLYMPEKGFGFITVPSHDPNFTSMSLSGGNKNRDIYFKQEEIVVNDKVVRDRALITNTKAIEGKEVCYSLKETPDGPHAMFVRIIDEAEIGGMQQSNNNQQQGGMNNRGGKGNNNMNNQGGNGKGNQGTQRGQTPNMGGQRGGNQGQGGNNDTMGTGNSNYARKREREDDMMTNGGGGDKRQKVTGPPGNYLPEEEENLRRLVGQTFRAKIKSWINNAYGFLICPAITQLMSGSNGKKDIWVKALAGDTFKMGDWVQFQILEDEKASQRGMFNIVGGNCVPEVDVQVTADDSMEMVYDPFGNLAANDIFCQANQEPANEGRGAGGARGNQGQQKQQQQQRNQNQQQQRPLKTLNQPQQKAAVDADIGICSVAGGDSVMGGGGSVGMGGGGGMDSMVGGLGSSVMLQGGLEGASSFDNTMAYLEQLTLDQLIQVNLKIAEKMANNDYVPEDMA